NQFLDRDDSLIQCATHGALFVVETGECVAGPCMGDCLEAVPIIEHNGELHLAEDQT
ncbi:Rieske (2Fe-2S) protein, partial [Litorivivens sp.]